MIWFVLYALYAFIQAIAIVRIDHKERHDPESVSSGTVVIFYAVVAPAVTCVLAWIAFDAFIEWCIDVDFTAEK